MKECDSANVQLLRININKICIYVGSADGVVPADRAGAAGGGHPAAAVLASAPEEEADAPGARRQTQAAVAQGAAAGALLHARRQPSAGE